MTFWLVLSMSQLIHIVCGIVGVSDLAGVFGHQTWLADAALTKVVLLPLDWWNRLLGRLITRFQFHLLVLLLG